MRQLVLTSNSCRYVWHDRTWSRWLSNYITLTSRKIRPCIVSIKNKFQTLDRVVCVWQNLTNSSRPLPHIPITGRVMGSCSIKICKWTLNIPKASNYLHRHHRKKRHLVSRQKCNMHMPTTKTRVQLMYACTNHRPANWSRPACTNHRTS